jgi:hypothetical protein
MSLLDTASLIVTPNGYKEGTLYSVIPSDGSGDMSVVRATTATRVNSAGLIESVANNIPRLDYSNGTCPSLLVEPQRTNGLTYSEDFSNVSWVKADSSVTSNAVTSPSGIQNADYLIPNTTFGLHTVTKLAVATTGLQTFSVFAKQGGYKNILVWFDTHSGGLGVNLDNLAIFRNENIVSYELEQYPNGWVYISITANITVLSNPTIYIADNGTPPQAFFSGNGTSGVYLWGAQLEAGSYPTSYIPTTSASVTRNADVVSKTGISSLIGQTEGTMFLDVDFTEVSDYNGWFMKDVANFDTFAFIQRENTGIIAVGYYGSGALQARIETAPSQPIGRYKIGFGYKNNDFVLYINGTQIGTDTSGSVSGLMNFLDAHYSSTGSTLQNAIALWKTRLTNTQLQTLTSI